MVKIGWLKDNPGFIGGAEVSWGILLEHAPEWAERVAHLGTLEVGERPRLVWSGMRMRGGDQQHIRSESRQGLRQALAAAVRHALSDRDGVKRDDYGLLLPVTRLQRQRRDGQGIMDFLG